MYAYVHIHNHAHVHTYIIYLHTYTHTYIHKYIHTYVYAYIYICIYIYVHTGPRLYGAHACCDFVYVLYCILALFLHHDSRVDAHDDHQRVSTHIHALSRMHLNQRIPTAKRHTNMNTVMHENTHIDTDTIMQKRVRYDTYRRVRCLHARARDQRTHSLSLLFLSLSLSL